MSRLTSGKVLQAVSEVAAGVVVPLNLPLTTHHPKRPGPTLELLEYESPRPLNDGRVAIVNDDRLAISLQGSSHWDALAHFGVVEEGSSQVYFGGRTRDETPREGGAVSIGTQAFPQAIVTRGVLLDFVRSLGYGPEEWLPGGVKITRELVEECLAHQAIEIECGDVVAVYTGFENRLEAAAGEFPNDSAGVDGSTVDLWMEMEVAGLVSDNPGVESLPPDFSIHVRLLRDGGVPLGELWALRRLAATAQQLEKWAFLLVSVPLRMSGLYGTPANAVAIF